TAGLSAVSATAAIPVVDGILTRSPAPANQRWVNAQLSLTPAQTAGQVGQNPLLTAALKFDTGAGFTAAPAGQVIHFNLSGPGGVVNSSCVTAADGSCPTMLQSNQTGLATVSALWSGSINTAEGAAPAAATASAARRWVDARVTFGTGIDSFE